MNAQLSHAACSEDSVVARPSKYESGLGVNGERSESDVSAQSFWNVGDISGRGEIRMRVVTDQESHERAFSLSQRIYKQHGYADSTGAHATQSGLSPNTVTLLMEDLWGRALGTISLVFDSTSGLSCEGLYGSEIDQLRANGLKLVEVTRLAIDTSKSSSLKRRTVFLKLFNFIYIFARHVRKFDSFLIEVNPRHAGFYRHLLGFEARGPVRSCDRVNGAPAVLLSLDLAKTEQAVRCQAGQGAAAKSRLLFPWFVMEPEETAIKEFLVTQTSLESLVSC